MPRPEECEWGIFFDSVHIITVSYARQEARLFENAGSGEGKLLFKKDEPAAKVNITDPFQLMNLAFHFAVSYELLAQVADDEALKFLEQVGAKDFLERLAVATPEAERRNRLNGLGPKFTTFDNQPRQQRGRPPKSPAVPEEAATASTAQ